jgi:hypothetical protein
LPISLQIGNADQMLGLLILFVFLFHCSELNGRGKSGMTGKPERLESQNDRKARTTGKPERLESQNDRKARTTEKPEQPESRNDHESRIDQEIRND